MTVITLHTVKHQTKTVLFSTFSFPIYHCLSDNLKSKWVKWFHAHVMLIQSYPWPLGYLHEKKNPPHASLASPFFYIKAKAKAAHPKICVRLICHKFRGQGLTMYYSQKTYREKWIEFKNKKCLIFVLFSLSLWYVQTDVLYNHQEIEIPN